MNTFGLVVALTLFQLKQHAADFHQHFDWAKAQIVVRLGIGSVWIRRRIS